MAKEIDHEQKKDNENSIKRNQEKGAGPKGDSQLAAGGELHQIFDAEGANAALVEAREAGKLCYIGFTGHKDPKIHLNMLQVAADCENLLQNNIKLQ